MLGRPAPLLPCPSLVWAPPTPNPSPQGGGGTLRPTVPATSPHWRLGRARSSRPQMALALDDLVRELDVGLAAGAVVVVEQDRLAVRGRLGHPDVAGDHGLVDLGAKEGAHLGRDLLGEGRARIVHGEHDALDLEARIERALDLVD